MPDVHSTPPIKKPKMSFRAVLRTINKVLQQLPMNLINSMYEEQERKEKKKNKGEKADRKKEVS